MYNNRDIPWKRITAEGGAIVVSILLAFWIDAWWDERQERQEEQQYLVALKTDFDQTRLILKRSIDSHRDSSEKVRELRQIVKGPKDSHSDSELAGYLGAVFSMDYPTVLMGTYRDMVNSGDLRLITDDQLRVKLVQFEGEWEAYRENTIEEVWDQWNTIMVPYLIPRIDIVGAFPDGYRGFDVPGGVHPIDRDQLWSLEFQNILAVAMIGDLDVVLQGQEVLEIVSEILALLEQEIQGES
ncbi:MAG: hypothetical protein QNJ40_02450 [Xanthomonadales bacterium]|nr:hypothetical protein [Xanthomonadales bacterium]